MVLKLRQPSSRDLWLWMLPAQVAQYAVAVSRCRLLHVVPLPEGGRAAAACSSRAAARHMGEAGARGRGLEEGAILKGVANCRRKLVPQTD